MTFNIDRLLEDLSGRFAQPYFEAVQTMFVAAVRNNRPMLVDARTRLQAVINETMGVAEVVGATTSLRHVARFLTDEGPQFRADRAHLVRFQDEQAILPRVTLSEAVDDFVERTPRTIKNAAERTAQRISELYSEGRNAAFVFSAEDSVTREVQDFITRALREGIPEGTGGRAIQMAVDEIRERSAAWTEAYSRMVFRTNVNTAVTAGRFRQVQDPDIVDVTPAFRYTTARDVDVRSNHARLDGLIFRVNNPVWNRIAPPLGYNCRCQVNLMSRPQLRRAGRLQANGSVVESTVPAGAGPDQGFRHGGRPDLFIAGVS